VLLLFCVSNDERGDYANDQTRPGARLGDGQETGSSAVVGKADKAKIDARPAVVASVVFR